MDGPKISRLYYTARDVCDILRIPQHILRTWEKKFSFLKPIRRKSGRRLFKPQDLELVRRIKKLKDAGYSDNGVSEILRHKEETITDTDKNKIICISPAEKNLILDIQRELESILKILEEA